MDDTEKNSENLPLEEVADNEGDNAEKSPSSPLSQHSSTQNLVVEDGYIPNTSHPLPPNSFEEFKRKFIRELFGDDDDDDSKNLPPEEALAHDEGDNNAEKSTSPPLSQCSTTHNLVIKDNGAPKTHRQSVSPKSYQEPKFKFLKKQVFGNDCDAAKMETLSDEQDSVTVSVQEAPRPCNDSKALHELKLKYLRYLFGDDDSDTTEDDDLRSTAKTSKRALQSFRGSNIMRETRPSSSAAENLAEETKPSNTDGAEVTSVTSLTKQGRR